MITTAATVHNIWLIAEVIITSHTGMAYYVVRNTRLRHTWKIAQTPEAIK